MAFTKRIKCANCGVFNTDKDYCENCNTLLSFEIKRAQKIAEFKAEEVQKIQHKIDNPNVAERLKKHPFFVVKIFGWILYSAYLLISVIGGLLAWFVAMVAAG